ncbi:MAG: sigma-70 family RNA polymerase sigma factor [Acidobacteria bacterium]|nr:sigma-70 family RNA polymerase sigma factor [Acidobacteriota bacterium]
MKPSSLKTRAERDALIAQNLHLVTITARKMRHPPAQYWDIEDSIGAGYRGLVEAAESFDPARGVQFTTYAISKIRGCILDGLRDNSPLTRLQHDQKKLLERSERELTETLGRAPDCEEIAAKVGVSCGMIARWKRYALPLSLDTPHFLNPGETAVFLSEVLPGEYNSLDAQVIEAEKSSRLWAAVARLPEREARVIRLYFADTKMTLAAIGKTLCVSETRAYQLLQQALLRLRGYLNREHQEGIL